jgi:hypothetical protein
LTILSTALLHLAQKYGPAVLDLKIRDYVPEAAKYVGWNDVRFDDAINMATGIGNGSTNVHPNDISDGYIDPSYAAWYEAQSEREKIEALLRDGRVYPWGPGKVTRYRDQDMFILGVAMDRFLKTKEGGALHESGGLTGVRLAKADESKDAATADTDGMARVADHLAPFCH